MKFRPLRFVALLPLAMLAMAMTCMLAATAFAQQTPPTATATPAPSPVATQSAAPQDENAVKARQVLDQMIAAMGGDKFLRYNTMNQEGRSGQFYNGRPTGVDVEFWSFYQYPDKERVELTPQRDVIELYNGDKGWEMTFKGAHEDTAEELGPVLAQRPYRLENVLRIWLKDPGTALFYDGSDLVDDQPVDKVTLINSRNQSVTLMIDSNSHRLAKKSFSLRDAQGYRTEESDIYANYHVVQGIATPFTYTHLHNGDITRERFLRDVKYDETYPANFFLPEGAPIGKKKKK